LEWAWTKNVGEEMVEAVLDEDWPSVAAFAAVVGEKFSNIEVSERHRMGKPWVGAYKLLLKENQ
jgi:hypothetical protein